MTVDPLDARTVFESSLVQAKQHEIEHLQQGIGTDSNDSELAEVAARFESVFLQFLIKQMWESVEKSDLLPEGPGRDLQEGMLTTMLADYLAEHGGLGIAKAMTTQLKTAAEAYRAMEKLDADNNTTSDRVEHSDHESAEQ